MAGVSPSFLNTDGADSADFQNSGILHFSLLISHFSLRRPSNPHLANAAFPLDEK